MKILMFIESGGPGGAERVVLELAQGLITLGHSVELAGLRSGWFTDKAKELGIKHNLIRDCSSFALPFEIAKIAKDFDLIHSHLLDSNFYCSLASKICKKPHLATEHGDVHHLQKKRFLKLKIKIPTLLGTHFCAVSNYTKSKILELGIDQNLVSVIGNPFSELSVNKGREQLRTELNLDCWTWINVANLRAVKDQQTLLRALAESKSANKLLLVGDGPLKNELEKLCNTLKIERKVTFLGHRQDIGDLLNACDGFVLSSISEAMPMSMLEAGSLGLTLAGSNVGGIPELIKNKDFLFPTGDHLALAKILDNHQTNKLEIKDFITQNFSRSSIVKKYLDLYSKLN